jgi:hypothetical protein
MSQELYSNSIIAPCTLTNGVIKQLVECAKFIFTIEDVKKIVSEEYSAKCVLAIFEGEFEDTLEAEAEAAMDTSEN